MVLSASQCMPTVSLSAAVGNVKGGNNGVCVPAFHQYRHELWLTFEGIDSEWNSILEELILQKGERHTPCQTFGQI